MSDSAPYRFIPSLADAVEIPAEGILSRPLMTDSHLRATLFGLSAGQELTEHTTTMEALIHVLEGEMALTLGDDEHIARGGAWIQMQPNLRHSVKALTPVKFFLVVLRDTRESKGGC